MYSSVRLSILINIDNEALTVVIITKTCRCDIQKKVKVGKDQEKAQSEKDSHSKNRGGKKTN